MGKRNTARNTFTAIRDRLTAYKKRYKEKTRNIGKYKNPELVDYFLAQERSILKLEGILGHGLQSSTEIQDALDIHDRKILAAAPSKRPDWVPPYLNQAWATAHPTDPDLAVIPRTSTTNHHQGTPHLAPCLHR